MMSDLLNINLGLLSVNEIFPDSILVKIKFCLPLPLPRVPRVGVTRQWPAELDSPQSATG